MVLAGMSVEEYDKKEAERRRQRPLWKKIASTGVFVPIIGVTWLGSGIVTVLLQIVIYVTVTPISLYWRQRINSWVVWWWYLAIVWLMEWWANCETRFFSPGDDFPNGVKAENAIVLGNHWGDVDWIVGWIIAEKIGALGSCKSFLKKATKYLPVLGWSWWMSDFAFMDRTWEKDASKLKRAFAGLQVYPQEEPFWLGLFCEGTRQSEQKLKESRAWCRANGKPELEHIVWPRTKGFAASAMALREKVEAVYSLCMGCPDDEREPSFASVLRAEEPVIHCCMRRWPIEEVPKDYDALRDWCTDVYIAKDENIRYCQKHGRFPGKEYFFPRRMITLVAMWFWTIFIQGSLALFAYYGGAVGVRVVGAIYVVFGVLLLFIMKYGERKMKSKKISPRRLMKAD